MRMPNVLIVPASSSIGVSREWDSETAALHLSDKSHGLELASSVCSRINSSRTQDKLADAKLREGMNISQKITWEPTDLIPIVTMTFPRKLN
jgi:hypothetical protein